MNSLTICCSLNRILEDQVRQCRQFCTSSRDFGISQHCTPGVYKVQGCCSIHPPAIKKNNQIIQILFHWLLSAHFPFFSSLIPKYLDWTTSLPNYIELYTPLLKSFSQFSHLFLLSSSVFFSSFPSSLRSSDSSILSRKSSFSSSVCISQFTSFLKLNRIREQ